MKPRIGATVRDHRPVERYLSGAAVGEASAILVALANRLARTRGVWADDANEDAQHIRALADALLSWCPNPSRPSQQPFDGSARTVHDAHDYDWSQVLALYLG